MSADRISPMHACGSFEPEPSTSLIPQCGGDACDGAAVGVLASIPRALAWTWMLPSDSVWEPQQPLPWTHALQSFDAASFRAAHRDSDSRNRRVVVAWKRLRQPLDVPALHGVVAVDFRRSSLNRLRAAGFRHLRRFAIVSNPAAPRWFIPMDRARVTAAALQLSQPTRVAARTVHGVLRGVVRAGWPLWFRHQLCVATRERSPLESHLAEVFETSELRVAFSSGNVDTVRNRKRILGILDVRGKMLGYAKIPATDVGAERLAREATVIDKLHRLHPSIAAPRVLDYRQVDGQGVLVTAALSGGAAGSALTAEHRQFLTRLQGTDRRPAVQSRWLQQLKQRLEASPPEEGWSRLLDSIWPKLATLVVPVTFQHGDFAPWNLRQQNRAIAAFDWEYGESDGLPLLDECHHRMSVEFFLKSRSLPRLMRSFHAAARSAALGLSPSQIHCLQIVYLLDHLCRLCEEGYPAEYPKRRWWQQALVALMQSEPKVSPQ